MKIGHRMLKLTIMPIYNNNNLIYNTLIDTALITWMAVYSYTHS